ncbi:hypothetical protein FOWG_12190 [Fusarium oxysporum f. sp. lycopersici MN25]|nr:hypothetical protein FOWG_12190 [Fusarium oxysporum f. sp. lycopersici MN25]
MDECTTVSIAFRLHSIGFLRLPQKGGTEPPIPDALPLVAHFAVRANGSKGCCCDENDNSWEPLSSEHVQLLEAFYAHQICDWKSDAEYLSDSFVVDFHPRLDRAYTKIKAATHNSHVTASTTDQDTIEHALAIENLRVQIDISNSLRGIFKTLHRRDAYSSLSNGKLELKRGYPTLPPRVGPDALPQRFFLETGQVDGIKRSAPGSDGKDAGGGKKPKTK